MHNTEMKNSFLDVRKSKTPKHDMTTSISAIQIKLLTISLVFTVKFLVGPWLRVNWVKRQLLLYVYNQLLIYREILYEEKKNTFNRFILSRRR